MFKTNYLLALSAAATIGLAGCGSHPPAKNMAQTQTQHQYSSNDDASINSRVQKAVDNVAGVHSGDITTQTEDAVVTMHGMVDNARSAEFAVQAARQVAGVKKVVYNVKVAP